MIRVVLIGRLGNTLFQYAWGRAAAARNGVRLVLDASRLPEPVWRNVACIQQLPGLAAGRAQVIRNRAWPLRVWRRLMGRHQWRFLRKPFLREPVKDQRVESRLLNPPPDCVALGYFQSPLYFQHMEDEIRSDLSLTELRLAAGHEELADQLGAERTVAVHVRRGDYLAAPHMVCLDAAYYEQAMQRMREEVPGAHFHIFTDDPAWCAKTFSGKDIELVNHDSALSPLAVMHLMSLCRHHIIANSSFSWWAAWLGRKPGQRVYFPDRWSPEEVLHVPPEEKGAPGWHMMPTSRTSSANLPYLLCIR